MPKYAIITGITGQDGSYLAGLLVEKGYQVVGVVRRWSAPNLWRMPEAEALASERDCVVIATDHRVFDCAAITREALLVVDTRSALKGYPGARVFRL